MQDDDIPERAATQRSKTTSQKRASVKRATAKKGGAPKAAAKKRAAKKARAGGAARKAATAPASPRSGGPAGRRYDFVLLGATGYTGGLTADYLADRAPQGARWAIAGRDARKLADVRTHLERVNPTAAAAREPPVQHIKAPPRTEVVTNSDCNVHATYTSAIMG
ncbi:MAG: hypothetical protein RLN67_10705, partial [Algiphilus sp.]